MSLRRMSVRSTKQSKFKLEIDDFIGIPVGRDGRGVGLEGWGGGWYEDLIKLAKHMCSPRSRTRALPCYQYTNPWKPLKRFFPPLAPT